MMTQIPSTDSIRELATFWQHHDVTDFENQLEEVHGLVFRRAHVVGVPLTGEEHRAIREAAASRGLDEVALIHEWVKERLRHMRRRTPLKGPTVLDAVKNLTVLKFTRDRDGRGVKAIVQLLGDERETQVWWRDPPKGERMTVHFRPYPNGWGQLRSAEQDEASKEAALAIVTAIVTPASKTDKAPRGKKRRDR